MKHLTILNWEIWFYIYHTVKWIGCGKMYYEGKASFAVEVHDEGYDVNYLYFILIKK